MSNKTTVAITSRYAATNPGGIEAFASELAPAIAALRPDWTIRTVHAFARPFRLERIPLLGDLIAAVAIAWKTASFDAVLLNGAEYAWPRAFLKGTRARTIVVWHGTRAGEIPTLAPKMTFAIAVYQYLEIALQRAALVFERQVVVGDGVLGELRATYGTSGGARVIVNGIPPDEPIVRVPTPSDILWVGTSAYKKGLDLAIAACRIARTRFPALRLRVVGLAETDPMLQSEPWIDVVGRIARPDVLAEYRTATLLLATTRYEGCSIAILEAMRHGVPIVASPVLDWMFEGCGCCAAALTAPDFAVTLEYGLASAEVRASWTKCARVKSARFTWDQASSEYVEEIEALVCRAKAQ